MALAQEDPQGYLDRHILVLLEQKAFSHKSGHGFRNMSELETKLADYFAGQNLLNRCLVTSPGIHTEPAESTAMTLGLAGEQDVLDRMINTRTFVFNGRGFSYMDSLSEGVQKRWAEKVRANLETLQGYLRVLCNLLQPDFELPALVLSTSGEPNMLLFRNVISFDFDWENVGSRRTDMKGGTKKVIRGLAEQIKALLATGDTDFDKVAWGHSSKFRRVLDLTLFND